MPGPVGIIINPNSGTDARRLTSNAQFMDSIQKLRIIKSVIMGLISTGINDIAVMPDYLGIAYNLIRDLKIEGVDLSIIDIDPEGDFNDTKNSIKIFRKENSPLIILLGGDGTIRAAAEESIDIPYLPLSTGTNNTIPYLVEGTVAGLAAGYFINYNIKEGLCNLNKIDIYINKEFKSIALVDVSTTNYKYKGTGIIDLSMIIDSVVIYGKPTSIGLASIGGLIYDMGCNSSKFVYINFNGNKYKIKAIASPGVVKNIDINYYKIVDVGNKILMEKSFFIEADGERLYPVDYEDEVISYVNPNGPKILDINKIMEFISKNQLFKESL
ncbi:NAD(+)/NADH kinase [Caldisphaera lagunensis]|nr:NAD(+)/NADH kinase [Caldisphaera lagunensis]